MVYSETPFVFRDKMEGIHSKVIVNEGIDCEGINRYVIDSEELLNYFYIK